MNGLVVFVDSLRFDAALSDNLQSAGLHRTRVIPPLGFSSNILPLLFQGAVPDEIGFYNEYGVSPTDRAPILVHLDRYTERLGRAMLLRKVIYRTLRLLGPDPANIPFRHLPFFTKHSSSAYQPSARFPSIFEEAGFRMVIGSDSRKRPPARDADALQQAMEAIAGDGPLYVSLTDLDSVSHDDGIGGAAYTRHQEFLRDGITALLDAFRAEHGSDAPVTVLSDHGMTNVLGVIQLEIERELGRPGRDSYLYFLDSTLLRVWCYDPSLVPAIESLLQRLETIGRTVTEPERERWGIAKRNHGDFIFVLNEGLIFDPNFIGRGVPKAMHGYHPDATSQHAVLLTNKPDAVGRETLEGTDVYDVLHRLYVDR